MVKGYMLKQGVVITENWDEKVIPLGNES